MSAEQRTRFKELRENYYPDGRLLKQEDLAKQLNTTRDIIVRIENDRVKSYDPLLLRSYALFFHTSVDYLLGYSDIRSSDPDIKAVCDMTGLSETAVALLTKNYGGSKKSFYNFFFEKYADTINRIIAHDVENTGTALIHLINDYLSFDPDRADRLKLCWIDIGGSDCEKDYPFDNKQVCFADENNNVSPEIAPSDMDYISLQKITDSLKSIKKGSETYAAGK